MAPTSKETLRDAIRDLDSSMTAIGAIVIDASGFQDIYIGILLMEAADNLTAAKRRLHMIASMTK